MHIHNNIANTIHLSSKGIPMHKAWTNTPIVKTDWIAIIIISATLASGIAALIYDSKDKAYSKQEKLAQHAQNALQVANNKIIQHESVLISFLNTNAIRENGKLVSYCKLDAAGLCK